MAQYVKSVLVESLHGHINFKCDFKEGANILYGRNGVGKTTLLHIISNAINKDYLQFIAIDFDKITLSFNDSTEIDIEQKRIVHNDHYHYFLTINGEEFSKNSLCPRQLRYRSEYGDHFKEILKINEVGCEKVISATAAYFPAFRMAIDAWVISKEKTNSDKTKVTKTDFARNLFGAFVPILEYSAISEIEFSLNEELKKAIAAVSLADRKFFGEVPFDIIDSFSDLNKSQAVGSVRVDEDINEIDELLQEFFKYPISNKDDLQASRIRSIVRQEDFNKVTNVVLNCYKKALKAIIDEQKSSFFKINNFIDSVNEFLEEKDIVISESDSKNGPAITINICNSLFELKKEVRRLGDLLSSGEREIVNLIYATTQMSKQDIILVDEPEISLNVDWQRKLISEMLKQMPSKQLIVCTHSPMIGAKFSDSMIELKKD